MELSKYQQAIINELPKGRNIVIEATAGSGKTTTLLEIYKRLSGNSIFLAFSNEIVKSISKEVEARTINSIGDEIIRRNYSKSYLNKFKYEIICSEVLENAGIKSREALKSFLKLFNLVQCELASNKNKEIEGCIDHFGSDVLKHMSLDKCENLILEVKKKGVEVFKVKGEYSFEDQVWLHHFFTMKYKVWDNVLVDESQDLNKAQLELVLKLGKRFIFCGDSNQCQPGETLVKTLKGTVPIKDIVSGTEILGYNIFLGKLEAGKVVSTQSDHISNVSSSNNLIVITSTDAVSRCTYEHRWPFKFKGIVYALVKDNSSSLRIFKFVDNKVCPDLEPEFNIVSVHKSFSEARLEIYHLSKHEKELILSDIYLPKYELRRNIYAQNGKYPVNEFTGICKAQDLDPELMLIRTEGGDWVPFTKEEEYFNNKVYSLDIRPHHTYIADGLVTHNSIMGFSGADCHSMKRIKEATNAVVLPLSICYRCPDSHLDLARRIVSSIENGSNKKGKVVNLTKKEMLDKVEEGDVIISRYNSSLISCAFELMAIGKKVNMNKTDTNYVCSIIKSLYGSNIKKALDKWRASQLKKNNFTQEVEDTYQCILACLKFNPNNSKDELVNLIKSMKSKRGIIMSSIHKSKGLEFENVYALNIDNMPSKWKGQKPWQLEQEIYLKYVALTRSTKNLYLVSL